MEVFREFAGSVGDESSYLKRRKGGKRGGREMSGLGWVECLGGDENGLLGNCWVRAC